MSEAVERVRKSKAKVKAKVTEWVNALGSPGFQGVWLIGLLGFAIISWWQIHSRLVLLQSRSCRVPWKTLGDNLETARVGMVGWEAAFGVALSDGRLPQSSRKGAREYTGVMEMTWDNKSKYAKEHSYEYIDASALLNTDRPPAWSKILATRTYLSQHDWIFWIDGDTVIMNPGVGLEAFIPESGDHGPDLVLTNDAGGANAGVWFIRNSTWSQTFLDNWWSMAGYIRGSGDTKSGDNDAFKALLMQMDKSEFDAHVRIAPQCAFNSYIWVGSPRNWFRLLFDTRTMETGLYRNGDFLLHLAGIDNKAFYIRKLLKEAH